MLQKLKDFKWGYIFLGLLFATVGELDSAKLSRGEEVVLVLDGQKIAACVKEMQINYMKSQIVHLDFCRA